VFHFFSHRIGGPKINGNPVPTLMFQGKESSFA
jgi:hypothetical protein